MWTYSGPGSVLTYINHIIYHHNHPKVVAIIFPIFQMGKLRNKEFKMSQLRK